MNFVLDASFTLHWFFENESTEGCEWVLTQMQNQEYAAFVPGIWSYEILNGLGKGVARKRIAHPKALALLRELNALPIRIVDVPADEELLELALRQNLAIYDASYLSLAVSRGIAIATGDGKLQTAARSLGLEVIEP